MLAVIIVSDTSPLSSLALVNSLSLLKEIYTTVIPQAVTQELRNAQADDLRISIVADLDWVEIREPADLDLIAKLRNERLLDVGEAESIALAVELDADELLIDERLGRQEARRLGLPFTGILGVLLVAKRKGLIVAVRPMMDGLINKAEFRVSSQLYNEVLTLAEESSAY